MAKRMSKKENLAVLAFEMAEKYIQTEISTLLIFLDPPEPIRDCEYSSKCEIEI